MPSMVKENDKLEVAVPKALNTNHSSSKVPVSGMVPLNVICFTLSLDVSFSVFRSKVPLTYSADPSIVPLLMMPLPV